MGRLEQMMDLLEHGRGRGRLRRWNDRFRALWHRGLRAVLRELPGNTALGERAEDMRWLQTATRTYAIEHLEEAVASSQVPTEDAATLLVEYQRSVAALHSARPSVTSVIEVDDLAVAIKRKAYAYELEQIQDAYEDERLSRAHAQRMRESVQLMQMDLDDTV
jgi:CPA1 family monovalent cation:H+ antiporter